jgi:hypothetical protein
MTPASPPASAATILKIDCPIKIVDIGANPIDGKPPYLPLLASGNARVVGFEPNLSALAELNNCKGPMKPTSLMQYGMETAMIFASATHLA